jgi:hypothetical protein
MQEEWENDVGKKGRRKEMTCGAYESVSQE